MFRKIILFFALIMLFTACQNRPLQQLGATSISQKIDKYELEGGGNVTVDILFVIDNSGSMAEEQAKVAENIENFMKMLKISAADGKTNYHIGIITTSVYDEAQTTNDIIKTKEDGRLLTIQTSSCSDYQAGKRYLEVSDNDDVVALLKNTIQCIGTDGVGIERGLDAIVRSLGTERTVAENVGFLRESAKLMIIIIGDEDDCSTGLRAYDPVSGATIDEKPYPIDKTRGRDCVEQSDLIPESIDGIVTSGNEQQNKLKPVKYYYDFLLEKKGGNASLLGFATIVGPLNCWSGEINDMGQGAQTQDSSIPFSFQNCSYSSDSLSQTMYDINFNTCTNNIIKTCTCLAEDTSAPACNNTADLLTTCFNNKAGTPNKIPIISESACSANYLHGHCKTNEDPNDENKHCAVTESGVKCVDNTCSVGNINGTCRADKTCNSGVCELKTEAPYTSSKDDSGKYSTSAPGTRFLALQQLVAESNAKDSYKYAICLEDFGTPLSLIGARLADSKCEYRLINRTDAPCTVAINIFAPEDDKLENPNQTNLNSPWIYTQLSDCSSLNDDPKLKTICEENLTKSFSEVGDALVQICTQNLDEAFSDRIDITKLLETVECGKDAKGEKACLKILFPDEGGHCPKPGSNVEIYYGVNE